VHSRWLIAVTVAAATAAVRPLTSQAQADAPRKFEVVSVKRNVSGRGGWSLNPLPGGRFSAQNLPVRQVVLFAYGLRDFQLINDPAWLQSLRFDIDARANADVPLVSMRDLVKSLLADRFGFAAHSETRQLPIYALVLLRTDRSPGPALKLRDCQTPQEAVRTVGTGCGSVINDTGRISGSGASIAMLANSLSGILNSVVTNKTGLSGDFDFELRWSDAGVAAPNQTTGLNDAPALTTAVQEQLGLRLQPDRGPVEVLVVDRVSEPTEN
jgi:uncharacterized protein (TIGR03435 family)